MSSINAGRRAFLRGNVLTPKGRASEITRQNPLGPRPPWHQEIPLELHCPDCTAPCVNACAVNIIRIHPETHTLANIPYLDFTEAGCTHCGDCVTSCPIDIPLSDNEKPVIGKATLNRQTCIAWDDVICMSCFNRCDYKAITTTYQRRAEINNDSCTGCGQCVSACPVNAITIV